MNVLFAILLAVYLLYALLVNRREDGGRSGWAKKTGIVLHGPLFASACYLAAGHGAFSRQLVSPPYIAAGFLAGHLIFGVSLLATYRSLRTTAVQLADLHSLWEYAVENPNVLMRFCAVGFGEEVIYRAAAQPLAAAWTGSPVAGILLIAAAFSLVHRHFLRNPMDQSAEFAAFAIVLGVLYYLSGSLILVIVIHAVRNIEIAFLEELTKTDTASQDSPAESADAKPCPLDTPERI